MGSLQQKPVSPVPIAPPPAEQRAQRHASFAGSDQKKGRYDLPSRLESSSPVGYRTRVPLDLEEAKEVLQLLSMPRPSGFGPTTEIREHELFEEASLGILTARQSTNYRGHEQVTLGPEDSAIAADVLRSLDGLEGTVLDGATYTHVALCRPYRTPFTLLLTFIGHKPVRSLVTVANRAFRKRFYHEDDIPTIGYLTDLHVGILADAVERAVVIASFGRRRANVLMAPFSGSMLDRNRDRLAPLEELVGLDRSRKSKGWRIAFVAQVGTAVDGERVSIREETCRKFGANQLAFRSERIMPGVNQDDKAPDAYCHRQDMDVPDELTVMAGRAAYNAFIHWTECDRERSKELMLLERIDVLTPNGKQRLRDVRNNLGEVTDKIMKGIPLWADLPTGKALSRNAARGKKAFALAGQRIYIGGLARPEVEAEGIDWTLAVRAFGAAAARSALVAEIMGVVNLPDDCDLLAGICLMAGPVNQNDIGKSFYGDKDLLAGSFPKREPTSLLVWTLKAKTVADPIGNEEQLMNAARKGALVDLRPGPHEVVRVRMADKLVALRELGDRVNEERAFFDVGNFVTAPDGAEIPGNIGTPWPEELRRATLW